MVIIVKILKAGESMKKLTRIISLFLIAVMGISITLTSCAPNSLRDKPVEHEHVAPLLMYVGLGSDSGKRAYKDFTDSDLQKIVDAGVNEFVLLTTFMPLYYCDIDEQGNAVGEPKLLCSEEDINSLTMEELGATTETDYQITKEKIIKDFGKGANKSTINIQIDFEIELAQRILAINPDAKFWFSLPHMKIFDGAKFYAERYMNVIYPKIKLAFTQEQFEKNVGGLYWSTEDAGGRFFNTDNLVDFDNSLVKAAKYCSDIVHADNKTLMWIPYTTAGSQIERVGMISNLTDIFDYVYLQPGYFWHESKKDFITLIDNSVSAGAVVNMSGVIYGEEKKSSTVIGAEIELDNNFLFKGKEDHLDRYNVYVETFSKYKKDKLFAVYCADRNHIMQPEVTELLFKWWE